MKTQNLTDIGELVRTFYETYKIEGAVEVRFGGRRIGDSDMQSVIDVYFYPLDERARQTIDVLTPRTPDAGFAHIQFLSDMVAPEVMGYNYKLDIRSEGECLKVCVNEVLPAAPVETTG